MSKPAEQFDLTEDERVALADVLPAPTDRSLVLRAGRREVRLPANAGRAVHQLLTRLAAGEHVQLVSVDAELTTRQAAQLLGISRTYLVRLVDEGHIPARLIGSHRRLRAGDVLAYRRTREARLAKVAAVAETDAQLGIDY